LKTFSPSNFNQSKNLPRGHGGRLPHKIRKGRFDDYWLQTIKQIFVKIDMHFAVCNAKSKLYNQTKPNQTKPNQTKSNLIKKWKWSASKYNRTKGWKKLKLTKKLGFFSFFHNWYLKHYSNDRAIPFIDWLITSCSRRLIRSACAVIRRLWQSGIIIRDSFNKNIINRAQRACTDLRAIVLNSHNSDHQYSLWEL